MLIFALHSAVSELSSFRIIQVQSMPRWFCTRHIGRTLAQGIVALMAMSVCASAQDSEHSDPLTLDDPKDWHQAYVPPSFGVIAHGSLPLFGKPPEGQAYQGSLRAGLAVYYDAWQLAAEMRQEATYVRFMPRTVGRDGYVAAVFEVGFASATGERSSYYYGTFKESISEVRYGMGIAVRTGRSESAGVRFLFDATYGLATYTSDIYTNGDNSFYYNLQAGVLLRVPIGPIALNAGPYVELGTGMRTVTEGSQTYVDLNESYFRGGLNVEIALNLNRPSYLTGAQ
jgi:hypothetical protein